MIFNKDDNPIRLDNLQKILEAKERELKYYKSLADEVAGYNILVDSRMVLLKRDLDQKKEGFAILASLHKVIGRKVDLDELLLQTLHLILTTLKMDKAVILWNNESNNLVPKWHLGYINEEIEQLNNVEIDPKLINGFDQLICNKSTAKDDDIQTVTQQLLLPFLAGVPLYSGDHIKGWLIAGRQKEAQPFFPPITDGDLFTFHSIGVFLEAAIDNITLYSTLEKANAKLASYNTQLEKEVEIRTRDIAISNKKLLKEQQKTDELLLNILPQYVADELKKDGKSKARSYESVAVLFTDFVNFTNFAERSTPEQLVTEIDYCFRKFDEIVDRHGIEKIKTIGDAYLCAGGISGSGNQIVDIIKAGIEMRDFIKEYRADSIKNEKKPMNIRLGIHLGPVVAGVVGSKKFAFDIWGDTVNVASRMETNSQSGKINVSGDVYESCKDHFRFEHRGKIDIKNKGKVDMYFVELK